MSRRQNKITKEMKDQLPAGFIYTEKLKMVEPKPFPKGDLMWRQYFRIDIDNLKHWEYHNAKGEILFIIVRKDTNSKTSATGKSRKFFPGTYASGSYHKGLLWKDLPDWKHPLYRLPKLFESDIEEVIVTEGEATCEAAVKLFPDKLVTTYLGGKLNYEKTDWSSLKNKKVTLFPDIDKSGGGYLSFINLHVHLKEEYGIEAKVVPFSENYESYNWIQKLSKGKFQKNAWDLADIIYPGIDIHELVKSAVIPDIKEEEKIPYSNIEEHKDNLVYLSNLGNKYWNRSKRIIESEKTINNLFLRAKCKGTFTKGSAHEWFQSNNINIVDGTAFWPNDKEYITFEDEENQKFVNLYRKPKFKPLEPGAEYNIDWLLDHMKMLASYDDYTFTLLCDTFAQAVQHPEVNRKWALVLYGSPGVGKGAFFEAISKCVGTANSKFMELQQLYGRFNSFLLKCNNLFIGEANNKGSEDNESQSRLKELISETKFQVELKGKEFLTHRCFYNLWLSTNTSNPVKVDKDDRRICYVNVEPPASKLSTEYFTDIFENKIENHERMRGVYHYFKYVYKISTTLNEVGKPFTPHKAPWTKWKADIIEESKTAYVQELDRMLEEKELPSFHYDLINKEEVMIDIKNWSISDQRSYANPLGAHNGFTKKQLQNWINTISGKFKYRHDAIQPKGRRRGHYWVVRNFDHWLKHRENIQEVHNHFIDPLTEKRLDKDLEANHDILDGQYETVAKKKERLESVKQQELQLNQLNIRN